jgi:hypothetical protein
MAIWPVNFTSLNFYSKMPQNSPKTSIFSPFLTIFTHFSAFRKFVFWPFCYFKSGQTRPKVAKSGQKLTIFHKFLTTNLNKICLWPKIFDHWPFSFLQKWPQNQKEKGAVNPTFLILSDSQACPDLPPSTPRTEP